MEEKLYVALSHFFDLFIEYRVEQAQKLGTPVVDVDGSYTYQQYKSFIRTGKHIVLPACPSPLLTGWRDINKDNYTTIGSYIPVVTSGSRNNRNNLLNVHYFITCMAI